MAVQALLFDVFGTLVDWRSSIAAQARPRLDACGANRVDAHTFADHWRGRYQPAMERIRSGGRGYVALDDLHRENLDETLAHFGVDAPADKRDEWARDWERLDPWPDVVPGLGALRERGLLVAPCSNGSIALMVRLARHGGLPWDCVLGADIARDYKPKPQVYLACCAALRLAPEDVMMVACHNDDLAGARDCGLATGFFPRPTEHEPGQNIDLAPAADWDVVAADLTDLAGRL